MLHRRFSLHSTKLLNPSICSRIKATPPLPCLLSRPHSTITAYANLRTDPEVSAQCIRPSPSFSNTMSLDELHHNFVLIPEFVTPGEHDTIVQHCEKKLKRSLGRNAPYEQGHFDGVISGYKECSVSSWSVGSRGGGEWMDQFIQQRIYDTFFPSSFKWLSPHILDLCSTGEIRGHVDNVEASGSVVAGLCLKSPAKMVLEHQDDPTCQVELFLPARCFYIQR